MTTGCGGQSKPAAPSASNNHLEASPPSEEKHYDREKNTIRQRRILSHLQPRCREKNCFCFYQYSPLISSASKSIQPLSSWDEYIGKTKFNFCSKEDILEQFKNKADYRKFAEKTLPSILERKEILKELEE
jgi:hypothetical protein